MLTLRISLRQRPGVLFNVSKNIKRVKITPVGNLLSPKCSECKYAYNPSSFYGNTFISPACVAAFCQTPKPK